MASDILQFIDLSSNVPGFLPLAAFLAKRAMADD